MLYLAGNSRLFGRLMSGCCGGGHGHGHDHGHSSPLEIQIKKVGHVLLDVRGPEEYSAEHIDGSMNIPHQSIQVERRLIALSAASHMLIRHLICAGSSGKPITSR